MRTQEIADAPAVNRTAPAGPWLACASYDLARTERRLWVEIPAGFTDMQAKEPALALEWRMATREIFTTYFARQYRAVDFVLDRSAGRGRYLLAAR
jgi:predicted GNAT superfamily acetyltransferase